MKIFSYRHDGRPTPGRGQVCRRRTPTMFTRFADTHVAHGAALIRPSVAKNFDLEGELPAVIGRRVFRETAEQAADAVAAWSIYTGRGGRPADPFPLFGGSWHRSRETATSRRLR